MSNNHKSSGFDYEPVGKVYAPNTQIIKNSDGTISLKPTNGANTDKRKDR
jgi:hypothetical protein